MHDYVLFQMKEEAEKLLIKEIKRCTQNQDPYALVFYTNVEESHEGGEILLPKKFRKLYLYSTESLQNRIYLRIIR